MVSIVILAAVRTPIGSLQGELAAVPAARLGAIAIKGALRHAGVSAADVTDCLMGNVLQAGQGQAPARQAALYAELPPSVRTVTIHKVCGSGLQALMQAAHALGAGMGSLVVAGGMENMSQAPYLLPKAREGYRLGHGQIIDSLISDGLWDPYSNLHMGACAEQCALKYELSREAQDSFAVASFQRAQAAQQAGRFAAEILPVEIPGAKGSVVTVVQDEGPGKVRYEKIPQLKPAFKPDGSITAANASSINDGAAALVVTTAAHAEANGWRPLARVIAFGSHAQAPAWFTTAPVGAAQAALAAAGWAVGDVDLWEINEAFAVVPLAFMRELGVPPAKVIYYEQGLRFF